MPMPEDMGHFRRSLERRRFDFIARLVPRRGVSRVLDVGCGSGWLSEMLAVRGFRVASLDIGLDSLRRASKRLAFRDDVSFVLGDVYRLPFGDDAFDAVVVSEVLEHLDTPADALCEIGRVVRPSGFLVASTPCRERIERTRCIHCNHMTPVNAHLHSFDEESLSLLIEGAGFNVARTVAFVNKPAERIGLAGFTGFLPYPAWRGIDALACGFLGRESFLAARAVRRD